METGESLGRELSKHKAVACADDSCVENTGTSELFKKDIMFIPDFSHNKRKRRMTISAGR